MREKKNTDEGVGVLQRFEVSDRVIALISVVASFSKIRRCCALRPQWRRECQSKKATFRRLGGGGARL